MWHGDDLAEHTKGYLNRSNYSSKAVDRLLMAITKLVDTNLRDAVDRLTQAKVPKDERHGVSLLNYVKSEGLHACNLVEGDYGVWLGV